MIIREYQDSDFSQLIRIHERNGLNVDFNLLKFPHRRVAEEKGQIIASLCGRRSMQVDLILDRQWESPLIRWELLKEMFRDGETEMLSLGIGYEHCFVPQEIERAYGKRLLSLGFEKEHGACFHKSVSVPVLTAGGSVGQ